MVCNQLDRAAYIFGSNTTTGGFKAVGWGNYVWLVDFVLTERALSTLKK